MGVSLDEFVSLFKIRVYFPERIRLPEQKSLDVSRMGSQYTYR